MTNDAEDWKNYQVLRNLVTFVIRSEKTKYYDHKIDGCKSDSKRMWRTIKELTGNNKQVIDFTNINYGNYRGTAEENFNTFYSNSIEEISNSIEKRN